MNLLKDEMKKAREKYEKLASFEGKIVNYEELSDLISKILEDYRPK